VFDAFVYLEGGQTVRREADTDKNKKVDVWEYYSAGVKTVQVESRGKCTKPNFAFIFAPDGERVIRQEEDLNCDGKPDALTELDEAGNPAGKCSRAELVQFEAGKPAVTLEDSDKNGVADRRQVFEDGSLVWLEADTNKDRKPDVWVLHENGNPALQYEDSNFDGKVDTKFDLTSQQPVELEKAAKVSTKGFEKITCSGFGDFWRQLAK
jgi:hypothetical protein